MPADSSSSKPAEDLDFALATATIWIPVLETLTRHVAAGCDLDNEFVAASVSALLDDAIPPEMKAAFLVELAAKRETPAEIAAFVRELRMRAVPVPYSASADQPVLDVCGTGGDRLNTFNISTTVALVCAAAGVTVAKHGNRAVTSQSGSADVLEALGIAVDLGPELAARSLRECRFAFFFFAPLYHPSFKAVAAARKLCAQQGRRTIFNSLGPMLNPVHPDIQLVGVPRPDLCDPLARTLQALGLRRALVASGEIGNPSPDGGCAIEGAFLDEFSTLGSTWVAELVPNREVTVSQWSLEALLLQPVKLEDLVGGDRHQNAGIIRDILEGRDRGPKRDIVLLNSGAALYLAGKASTVVEGWKIGSEQLDSGAAAGKLEELRRFQIDVARSSSVR